MGNGRIVRTIETCICELEDGSFVLVACKGKRQRKKRTKAGTPERTLRAQLAEMRAAMNRDRSRATKGTLTEDVGTYLETFGTTSSS